MSISRTEVPRTWIQALRSIPFGSDLRIAARTLLSDAASPPS